MRTILGVVFLGTLVVAGCAGATGTAAPSASAAAPSAPASAEPSPSTSAASPEASPSASAAFGGTVEFLSDGAPTTTLVDVTADGSTVSGTAVTTFRNGTHTVRLGCASQNGDTWALGGKTEKTSLPGERAGDWSAVIVKDGSPQRIGIWLSDDPSAASDCQAWLAKTDFATISAENFSAVVSGALVPPPIPAS